MGLLARKPVLELIRDEECEATGLRRSLSRFNLITLGVGAIIGAGIFVVTGQAAANYAGPAIVLSFFISAIACALAGLCYAELASMIPLSGSAYTYAYATLGELFAWIIGWDLILEYLFGATFVAVGWSGYVTSMFRDFGIDIPGVLCNAPFAFDHQKGWLLTGAWINLPSVLVVLMVTGLLLLGVKESARFTNIVVVIKVLVILLFVGFGLYYVDSENWKPFVPPNTGSFGSFGLSGVFRGAGVIFIAYIGFDVVSTAAQEAKNPQKDMPYGILLSLVISTILYVLVALVLTGIVKYTKLNVPDPIAVGVDAAGRGLAWLRPIIKIGAVAGLTTVLVALIYGQPRIFYAMSRDGLLPPIFSKVSRRFRTPYITTIMTGLAAALIAGLFPIGVLAELVSVGTLMAFAIVCIGVLVLRYKEPDLPRPFRTPLVPLVPALGAVFTLMEIAYLPSSTWARLAIWMAIGLAVYFGYGRYNSKLQKEVEPPEG